MTLVRAASPDLSEPNVFPFPILLLPPPHGLPASRDPTTSTGHLSKVCVLHTFPFLCLKCRFTPASLVHLGCENLEKVLLPCPCLKAVWKGTSHPSWGWWTRGQQRQVEFRGTVDAGASCPLLHALLTYFLNNKHNSSVFFYLHCIDLTFYNLFLFLRLIGGWIFTFTYCSRCSFVAFPVSISPALPPF